MKKGGIKLTDQAVTTNPMLIMVINMTIVFGVLFLLGYVIKLIYWIDPTKKKQSKSQLIENSNQSIGTTEMEEKLLVAIITTAIMAYGYKDVRITSIRKI